MAKKDNGFFDDLIEKGEKKAKRRAKSKIKKLHPATKALAILFLIIGIAAGFAACTYLSKNDRFVLKGKSNIPVNVGEEFTYTEQGVEAICFGRDVTAKLSIVTDLQKDANGNYIIPTDKEGVYTITYTVDAYKFQKGPNGVIKRIRTFTVSDIEEDGRDG